MIKQILLSAGLLITTVSFSQFTQSNEPAVGSGTTLYVIDSMAPSYENVTGADVEWDYSTYGGYFNEDRLITILDATSSSEYPTATKSMDIQNFILTYTYSTTAERISPGFVYTDGDLGDVVIVFDIDEATQYQYPFDLGDSFTDTYAGTATVGGTENNASGVLNAEVDGKGTLKLADGNIFSNVLRYKLVDSTVVNTGIFGDVRLIRKQFEYYALSNNQNLPIFVFTHIEIPEYQTEFSLVMSSVEPIILAGIEENVLSNAVVYPNPASDLINISMKNKLMNTSVSVVDAMGREVLNQSIESDFIYLDVAHLEDGMYFVKISNGDFTETKTVVIK